MLILGAVVDQQQNPHGRKRLDQQAEQRLRLSVNPVQVLKNDDQRLI